MSTPTISFNSDENNRITITASGGEDNQSYTMTYGGFENTFTFASATKTGTYTGTPREEVDLEKISHVLTNKSSHIEGINEVVSNVSIEMVGDRYYQDAEAAQSFVDNMSSHIAQRSSPGNNDSDFDLMSMLMPINMTDIANKISSVVEFPSNLMPMPNADSIWNLPLAMEAAAVNQAMIEAASIQKQLSMVASAQMEMCDIQNMETVKEMEEDGASDIVDSIMSLFGGLSGVITPETKAQDSYSLNDDMIYAGMQDWVESGGIDIERNI